MRSHLSLRFSIHSTERLRSATALQVAAVWRCILRRAVVDTCVEYKLDIFEQRFSTERQFKLRLQIGSPSQGFFNNQSYLSHFTRPFTMQATQGPHFNSYQTSFSDDSRVPKISGCYLRAAEFHSRGSPPTVTLNTVIKRDWVLLSRGSFRSLVGIQLSLSCCCEKAFLQPHKQVRSGGTSQRGQKVIKFLLPLTHADLVWGQRRDFRCEMEFFPLFAPEVVFILV